MAWARAGFALAETPQLAPEIVRTTLAGSQLNEAYDREDAMTWGRIYVVAGLVGLCSLGACTGGDMGNTRGGGAAPGQSGGRETTGVKAAPATPSSSATADSTKRGATTATKRP